MKKYFGLFGALVLIFAIATPASAEGDIIVDKADSVQSVASSSKDKLTGDWGGLRSDLSEQGVTFNLFYTTFYQGMFSGTGDDDFEFGDRVDALINLDLGKLGLWQNSGLHTHLEYNSGNAPGWRGGALIPVNSGMSFPFTKEEKIVASSIYLSHRLSNSASVLFGKINAVDLLDSDPFYGGGWGNTRFMNLAFSAPPSGILPPTIIGGIVNYTVKPITWTFMVYDPNDQTDNYSLNDLFSDGVNLSLTATWIGEWAGRASSMSLNGIYSTKDTANLGDLLLPPELQTGDKDHSWHFSLKLTHLLIESQTLPGKGLGFYVKAGISDGNPNPFQSFITGGLAGHGMVFGRSNDVFGIGYYYYNFSDDLQDATSTVVNFHNEQGVEVFYNFAVTPWLGLTADLQWIDPANGDNDHAWLGGLRANISF